jgi:3-keto-5-aminohexanoate cleavage enzyme
MEKLIIYAAVGFPEKPAGPFIPAIPRNWDELVDSAVAAHEAGASIVHLHGPLDNKGRIIPEKWAELGRAVRRRCDVLIDFGKAGAPLEQRMELMRLGADNPDFMAVSLTGHDYRRIDSDGGQFDVYYEHKREELEEYARILPEAGIKPAWELWHLGGLWNFHYLVERGLVAKPYWLNLFFGTPGGVWSPPTVEEITHRIAQLPPDAPYLLAPRGTAGPMGQTRMLTLGIIKGGHVRLGTQDMAYYTEGVPAQSNAQIVARIARISRELGREIATPDDTRRILGLPARR